jgi:hypothetical protein
MKPLNILLINSFILTCLLLGCSKGDTGPAGPQGPQGNTGAQGNANVNSIFDSTKASSNWTYIPGDYWYTVFTVPALSSTFIGNGGYAEVFLSTDDKKVWSVLPTTYSVDSVLSAQMTCTFSANTVQVFFTWSDLKQHTDPVTTFGATCYFNIVCIAPTVLNKYPATQWNNYNALMSIPEAKHGQD